MSKYTETLIICTTRKNYRVCLIIKIGDANNNTYNKAYGCWGTKLCACFFGHFIMERHKITVDGSILGFSTKKKNVAVDSVISSC